MSPLVLDTSGILALVNAADPAHARARGAVEAFDDLVVPGLVLVEVDYWLRKAGGGAPAFTEFMADVHAGAYRLEIPTEGDLVRAAELGETYSDLDLGIVDASVVALCERLRLQDVLTLDRRDFSVVRPRHCEALHLLPVP